MLTVIEKVVVLQTIDLFAEVPSEQLALLAAIAEEVRYASGEIVYEEADPPDALYLVLTGKVRLHRGEEEIATAGSKETFGVWALFDDEPRVATATVVDAAEMLRIDKDDFIDLLADHVQIAEGVLKTVTGRLRRLIERIST